MKNAWFQLIALLVFSTSFSQPPPAATFENGKFTFLCYPDTVPHIYDGFNGYTAANFYQNYDTANAFVFNMKKYFYVQTNFYDTHYDGKKWALFDWNCKQLTPFAYDLLYPFKPYTLGVRYAPYLFLACKSKKWGVVDLKGKELIPCEYDLPYADEAGGDCYFTADGGYCDLSKELMCGARMFEGGYFDYPMMGANMIFIKNGKYGAVDTLSGKPVTEFAYDMIIFGKNGIHQLKKGKKYAHCLDNGKILPYDEVSDLKFSFYRVRKGSKWGIINERSEEVVPCKYDEISEFSRDETNGTLTCTAQLNDKYIAVHCANGVFTFEEE